MSQVLKRKVYPERHVPRGVERSRRVFVGMSGGVDSSVSAALLKKVGYDVTGIFIKVWRPPFTECAWKNDRLDAMRVAAQLDIPFFTLDLEKEYKRDVVDYMISEYKEGRVPNPDVMCNRFVKFGAFYDWAMKRGADFVATGHYAQIKIIADSFQLIASEDKEKDQTYFLWNIKKEQLPHILFPVGGMTKPEVRKLAKQFGLVTADKKDSQGLCFMGKVDIKDFLSHFIKPKKGKVLDEKGKVIGEHNGVFFFTIGQRHGFEIKSKTSSDKPYYVVGKNMKNNTVTVSHKESKGAVGKPVVTIHITQANWLGRPPKIGKKYEARFRYRQTLISCKYTIKSKDVWIFRFDRPQTGIASGQSLVVYSGKECLGGGIIEGTN